jgi:hypothetical protein
MKRLAVGLYAFLLNLYSRRFRAEFAGEMQAVFAAAAAEAAERSVFALAALFFHELRDLPGAAMLECLREGGYRKLAGLWLLLILGMRR